MHAEYVLEVWFRLEPTRDVSVDADPTTHHGVYVGDAASDVG